METNFLGNRTRAEQARARYLLRQAVHEDAHEAPQSEPPVQAQREKPKGPSVFARIGKIFGKIRLPSIKKGELSGIEEQGPSFISKAVAGLSNLKWVWAIVALLIVIVALKFFGPAVAFSPINLSIPASQSVRVVAPPAIQIFVGILELGMMGLVLFSLFESTARRDPFLLDFFSCWIMVALLVFGQIYGHETQLFSVFLGAAGLGMLISTFYNPSDEASREWWDRFDTTHWYVASVALIILKLMGSAAIPYPEYVPIIVPIVVTIVGAGKEFFRQAGFSLLALTLGLIPAYMHTLGWIAGMLAVIVIIAALTMKVGWVTARKTDQSVSLGGRSVTFFLAWDLVIFYVVEVTLVGYLLYGNYPLITIGQ
jgi:hypothetical protein